MGQKKDKTNNVQQIRDRTNEMSEQWQNFQKTS